jgi:hypothetical protein
MAEEIRFLGDMQRLRPEPGDVYVVSSERPLSMEQCNRIRQWWEKGMGDAKLLIVDCGLKLGVIAAPEKPQ